MQNGCILRFSAPVDTVSECSKPIVNPCKTDFWGLGTFPSLVALREVGEIMKRHTIEQKSVQIGWVLRFSAPVDTVNECSKPIVNPCKTDFWGLGPFPSLVTLHEIRKIIEIHMSEHGKCAKRILKCFNGQLMVD